MPRNFNSVFIPTILAAASSLIADHGLAQDDPSAYCSAGPTCNITRDIEVTSGSNVDFGDRIVNLSGILSVRDGVMTIQAAEFRIVDQGQLNGTRGAGGGSFTIIADGDIEIDGRRASGAVALNGPDGGFLTLQSTAGRIFGAGRMFASHRQGDPLGDGGSIGIVTGGGVDLTGTIEATGGVEAGGGELDIVAAGDVTLSGLIDVRGGEDGGGAILIESGGKVTVIGDVELDGQGEVGDGGSLDIAADSATLSGRVRGRGSNNVEFCGDSSDVTVDAAGNLDVLGEIDVSSRWDCLAGTLDFNAGSVSLRGPINIRADGSEGQAGSLNISVTERVECLTSIGGRDIDGRGNDGGGTILVEVDSSEPTTETFIGCAIDLTGPLGGFELDANTNVTINGAITAGETGATPETPIRIEGCTVQIGAAGSLIGRGNSTNVLVAREQTNVAGSLQAGAANELRFRPGLEPVVTGQVVPGPTFLEDETLPGCGFAIGTPTMTRTPTITRTPTRTPTPRRACIGDCNEDGVVSIDELVLGIDIGLGGVGAGACPALDKDDNGEVDVSENITAVSNSLNDCAIVR